MASYCSRMIQQLASRRVVRKFAFLILTIITISSSAVLSACSTSTKKDNAEIEAMLDQEVGDVNNKLVSRILEQPKGFKSDSRVRVKVKDEIHQKIIWWMHYYSVRDHARFKRNLERGEQYKPLVQQILRSYNLPPELYYLALIESGYVNHAISSTKAVGIWQFMRPTALNYGLGVDEYIDERRDPIAATHAAARHLIDLHDRFQSWYLAIAAYNCGQGRVQEAIRKGKTRDFWTLVEKRFLPKETIDYIPKFLAAATIGENLAKFHFEELKSKPIWPELQPIDIKLSQKVRGSGLHVATIAKQAKLNQKDLLRFNPQLKQVLNHPNLKRVRIWLPKEAASKFATRYSGGSRS